MRKPWCPECYLSQAIKLSARELTRNSSHGLKSRWIALEHFGETTAVTRRQDFLEPSSQSYYTEKNLRVWLVFRGVEEMEREKEWITVVFSSCKLASVQKDALNTHTETACLLLFVIGGWFRQSAWMVYYSEHKYSFVVRTSKKHHKVDGVDTTLNHSLRYGKMWKQIVFPVCLDGRVGERCVSVITLR